MNVVGLYRIFLLEIRKISWVSFKKMLAVTSIVLSVIVVGMLFFLAIDYLILRFLGFVFGYVHGV